MGKEGNSLCVIYQIKNKINNKVYVGSSVNHVVRFRNHRYALKKGIHHSIHLQRSWSKYGEENFVFEILEERVPQDKVLIREQYWMDVKKSYNKDFGYNISSVAGRPMKLKPIAGEDCNLSKLTEGQVALIRESLKDPHILQQDTADKFNITLGTISAIKNDKTWRHTLPSNISYTYVKRSKSPKAKSQYLGVYARETDGENRYTVTLFPDGKKGKRVVGGTFEDELIAANMYNHIAIELYGEDCLLNEVEYISKEECEKLKLRSHGIIKKGRKKDSGFIGVTWNGREGAKGRWRAFFKEKQIGVHRDPLECAKIYNRKAIDEYGVNYEGLNRDENGEVLL